MTRLSDYISSEEMKSLRKTSDLVGLYRVAFNYALIVAAFAAVIVFPNPYVFVAAAFVMGGRILGLGILNHDAGHGTLFKNRKINDWVGRWLLGSLILIDFDAYRKGHLNHHKHAGTEQDPDLIFVQQYPVGFASMMRKFARDMFGITGLKELLYQIKVSTVKKRLPTLVSHVLLFTLLYFIQQGWAYSLFWAGYFFAYPLFSRLRIMGEHGAMAERFNKDPRFNTRTTLAGPLEKLFIAPNDVHYHLEHHINSQVPAQNLNKFHQLLRKRGYFVGFDCVESSYLDVIKKCITRNPKQPTKKSHAASSVANMS